MSLGWKLSLRDAVKFRALNPNPPPTRCGLDGLVWQQAINVQFGLRANIHFSISDCRNGEFDSRSRLVAVVRCLRAIPKLGVQVCRVIGVQYRWSHWIDGPKNCVVGAGGRKNGYHSGIDISLAGC